MSNDNDSTDNIVEENTIISIEDIEALLSTQLSLTPLPEMFPGDPEATWVYWGLNDTAERGIPDEYVWERLRNKRDYLLSICDWRVATDASWDTTPWITYRQALRDLPSNTDNPRQAIWPVEP